MRAVRMHAYGGPDVLRYEDAPRPEPGAGEVLVRVRAAGVNPLDAKLRSGSLRQVMPLTLPWTPGVDVSGTVAAVGPEVTSVRVGDEVFGKTHSPRHGGYAEIADVRASGIAPKPRTLDHVHAAAVPLAALTAWQGLFDGLHLASGQRVLILGASGGVGTFAVQLAVAHGARVIATARDATQVETLRSLGAEQVIRLPGEELATAGTVDAVLDLVGGPLRAQAWPLILRGGAIASPVGTPDPETARAHGVRGIGFGSETNQEQLVEIGAMIDRGAIQVVVGETLPLAEAARAHARLEQGGVSGKVVLEVAGD